MVTRVPCDCSTHSIPCLAMAAAPLVAGRDVDAFAAAVENPRLVLLRVDLNLVVVGRLLGVDPRDDLHRLAGGLHAIHAGCRDADALLPAALPQPVKLRAVEQLAENQRNLLLDDAGAVVLDADFVAVEPVCSMWTQISGRMPASSQASSELSTASLTVVSSALRGLSKPEQVAVLGEELADRDVALGGGHAFGRGPAAPARRNDSVIRIFRSSVLGVRRVAVGARFGRNAQGLVGFLFLFGASFGRRFLTLYCQSNLSAEVCPRLHRRARNRGRARMRVTGTDPLVARFVNL